MTWTLSFLIDKIILLTTFIHLCFKTSLSKKMFRCNIFKLLIKIFIFKHWKVTAVAAATKSLQSCPTLCDPIDGSPRGSPSLGFSRQEHWSGLPFPSPMHESEKWKGSLSVVSDSSWPHRLQPTRLLRPWDFLGKSTGLGCHLLLRY